MKQVTRAPEGPHGSLASRGAVAGSVCVSPSHGICVLGGVSPPPGGPVSKESACHAGDAGLILGLGRPPGAGNGSPLQDSCLETPVDRGAWRAAVHGVAESDTTEHEARCPLGVGGRPSAHPRRLPRPAGPGAPDPDGRGARGRTRCCQRMGSFVKGPRLFLPSSSDELTSAERPCSTA